MTFHRWIVTAAVLIAAAVSSLPAKAATYYVRADGHDGASGANNTADPATGAWAHVSKANGLHAGDQCIVMSLAPADTLTDYNGSTSLNAWQPTNAGTGYGAAGMVTLIRNSANVPDSTVVCPLPYILFGANYQKIVGFRILRADTTSNFPTVDGMLRSDVMDSCTVRSCSFFFWGARLSRASHTNFLITGHNNCGAVFGVTSSFDFSSCDTIANSDPYLDSLTYCNVTIRNLGGAGGTGRGVWFRGMAHLCYWGSNIFHLWAHGTGSKCSGGACGDEAYYIFWQESFANTFENNVWNMDTDAPATDGCNTFNTIMRSASRYNYFHNETFNMGLHSVPGYNFMMRLGDDSGPLWGWQCPQWYNDVLASIPGTCDPGTKVCNGDHGRQNIHNTWRGCRWFGGENMHINWQQGTKGDTLENCIFATNDGYTPLTNSGNFPYTMADSFYIVHNTFYAPNSVAFTMGNSSTGPIPQWGTASIVRGNIFYGGNSSNSCKFLGSDQPSSDNAISIYDTTGSHIGGNLVYQVGGTNRPYSVQTGTMSPTTCGNDSRINSLWGDPQFANPAGYDFTPSSSGPAVDSRFPAGYAGAIQPAPIHHKYVRGVSTAQHAGVTASYPCGLWSSPCQYLSLLTGNLAPGDTVDVDSLNVFAAGDTTANNLLDPGVAGTLSQPIVYITPAADTAALLADSNYPKWVVSGINPWSNLRLYGFRLATNKSIVANKVSYFHAERLVTSHGVAGGNLFLWGTQFSAVNNARIRGRISFAYDNGYTVPLMCPPNTPPFSTCSQYDTLSHATIRSDSLSHVDVSRNYLISLDGQTQWCVLDSLDCWGVFENPGGTQTASLLTLQHAHLNKITHSRFRGDSRSFVGGYPNYVISVQRGSRNNQFGWNTVRFGADADSLTDDYQVQLDGDNSDTLACSSAQALPIYQTQGTWFHNNDIRGTVGHVDLGAHLGGSFEQNVVYSQNDLAQGLIRVSQPTRAGSITYNTLIGVNDVLLFAAQPISAYGCNVIGNIFFGWPGDTTGLWQTRGTPQSMMIDASLYFSAHGPCKTTRNYKLCYPIVGYYVGDCGSQIADPVFHRTTPNTVGYLDSLDFTPAVWGAAVWPFYPINPNGQGYPPGGTWVGALAPKDTIPPPIPIIGSVYASHTNTTVYKTVTFATFTTPAGGTTDSVFVLEAPPGTVVNGSNWQSYIIYGGLPAASGVIQTLWGEITGMGSAGQLAISEVIYPGNTSGDYIIVAKDHAQNFTFSATWEAVYQ